MVFSNSSLQDFPDTGRSIEAYIVFYQGVKIDHYTHVTVPVDQSSVKGWYNSEFTAVMALAHCKVISNELLNKNIYVVP